MSWEITANLGVHARPEGAGRGWLWEITRDGRAAQVVVEITEEAWSTNPLRLPDDTRQALETDGRAALLKVLVQDDPPRVIRCGSGGRTHSSG